MKTKIKSHGVEEKDFYDKEIPIVDSNHSCLPVISLDSGLKKRWKLLSASQVFFKEFKYIEKKLIRHINDYLSDFTSYDESDEE